MAGSARSVEVATWTRSAFAHHLRSFCESTAPSAASCRRLPASEERRKGFTRMGRDRGPSGAPEAAAGGGPFRTRPRDSSREPSPQLRLPEDPYPSPATSTDPRRRACGGRGTCYVRAGKGSGPPGGAPRLVRDSSVSGPKCPESRDAWRVRFPPPPPSTATGIDRSWFEAAACGGPAAPLSDRSAARALPCSCVRASRAPEAPGRPGGSPAWCSAPSGRASSPRRCRPSP